MPKRGLRFVLNLSLAGALAGAPALARADGAPSLSAANQIQKVAPREVGGKTVITVQGSATPSFTAYRLERPARLVVDLADGRLGGAAATEGTIDVDSWAVGQISLVQRSDATTRMVRLMIGFKRASSYDVQAHGNDVLITITPDEAPPANQLRDEKARAEEAKKQRVGEEARRKEAQVARQKAEEDLSRIEAQRADTARKAAEARAEAEKRQAELDAVRGRVGAETAKAEEAERAAQARLTASQSELERIQAQRSKLVSEKEDASRQAGAAREALSKAQADAARQAESARTAVAKAQAERDAAAREVATARAELEKMAQARKSEQDALAATRKEMAEVSRARGEEEARLVAARAEAKRVADEAVRLAAAQEKARREAESQAARLELARREVARAAADRAAEVQRLEQRKGESAELAQARAEAKRLATEAQTARGEAEKAKESLSRLDAQQTREIARAKQEVATARERADRAEQLAKASSGVKAPAPRNAADRKLQAAREEAERMARARDAELAQLEAAREARRPAAERKLQAARDEAERMARSREAELAQLEAARVEARRLAADRAAEVARLDRIRAEIQQMENARREAQRELSRLQKQSAPSDTEQRLASAKAELARFEKALADARSQAAAPAPTVVERPLGRSLPTPSPLAAYDDRKPPAGRSEASGPASVTDVAFQDRADVARVVIAVTGDADYTILRSGSTTTLRLRGTALPARLARTLDTAAFRGPISSVSTYVDPRDPGAVHVDVKLGQDVEPDVHREGDRIVWEFPKANGSQVTTRSYPPSRMAPWGPNSLPLQISPAAGGTGTDVGKKGAFSGTGQKKFIGSHIDLDFKDADIHNILRLLADVGSVNIITSDDVRGSVTIRMRDVPWDQALDVILKAKGLGMIRSGNLIRVAPQQVLEKELELEIARNQQQASLLPLTTRLLGLSFSEATQLMPRVQDLLSSRGKVSVDLRTNTLIISDIAGNIALAEALVRTLDTQTPQVLIEARIVEARASFSRSAGIQWGGNALASAATGNPTGLVFPSTLGVGGAATDGNAPNAGLLAGAATSPNYVVNMPAAIGTGSGGGLGFTFGNIAGTYNVNLRLSAAETTGNLRILSAPKVTTLDNAEANIEQGTSIPIQTTSALGTNTVFIDAKLSLRVKPHVTNEGSVVMQLDITRNEPDFSRTGSKGDPTILKRQAKTQMMVRDGDTAVIGGIYSRNTSTNFSKVPWIAEVPILGWLFKTRTEFDDRSELLIFITPRILNRPTALSRQ